MTNMRKPVAATFSEGYRYGIRSGVFFSTFVLGVCLLCGPAPALAQQSQAAMPMALVAPLFIEDEKRTSVVTMVNTAPDGLDVDVVLSRFSGEELARRTLSIGPHAQQTVAVADLLKNSASQYGSVLLAPHRNTTMGAQLSIMGRNGAIMNDVEEEFLMMMGSQPSNYRAVSASATPLVAIRSVSSERQTLSVGCVSGDTVTNGQVSIGPGQTLLIHACAGRGPAVVSGFEEIRSDSSDDQKAAAVSVSSSAPSMDLAVFGVGFARRDRDRDLVAIPFADCNELKSATAVYPGALASGRSSTKFQAALANFGAAPRQAKIMLSAGNGPAAGQKTVATLKLAPHSVSLADLADMPDETNVDASLIVETDGTPGEVLNSIQAVGRSGAPLNVPLPWKDKSQTPNGGQHPWRIDGGFTSAIRLYNPDTERRNSVALSIYAGNGARWNKTVVVEPLSTVAIRINDIVAGQQPDDKGNKLPADSVRGMVHWFTLAKPKIIGMLAQSDLITGVVRPFACASTYALCSISLPSELVGVGAFTGTMSPTVTTCGTNGDCTCVDPCITAGSNLLTYSWFSANSSILSLVTSPTSSTANYQGVSTGSTSTWLDGSDNLGCMAGGGGPADVVCAIPTNFSTTNVTKPQNGALVFTYVWGSSTGKQTDLSACTVGETVFYPSPNNPYVWPLPMVQSTVNPAVISGAGSNAGFTDTNGPPSSYQAPYVTSGFSAMQRFWWRCPCYQNGDQQVFGPDITIRRDVFQDVDSLWKYRITKSGETNTVTLP